jgi:hypothetical protein
MSLMSLLAVQMLANVAKRPYKTRFWPLRNFWNVPLTLRFVPLNIVNLYGVSKSTLERPA